MRLPCSATEAAHCRPQRGRLQAIAGLVANGADHGGMDLHFTAVFREAPEGYIGFARANLQEAVEMVLQANRELIEEAAPS